MDKDALVEPKYLSYLLRLRRVREGSGYAWRASLEQVGRGERHNFASLKALLGYLELVTRNDREADEGSLNKS